MRVLLFVIVFMFSGSLFAETWRIGKTIEVSSSNLDVTFQVFPDFDPNEELVHGWKGEDLQYLVLVDQQPGGLEANKYWKGMLKEIKNDADNKKVTIISEGTISGASNNEISYKLLRWLSEGDEMTTMYYLVAGQKYTYWVSAISFTNEITYMEEQTKTLLKSALLLE